MRLNNRLKKEVVAAGSASVTGHIILIALSYIHSRPPFLIRWSNIDAWPTPVEYVVSLVAMTAFVFFALRLFSLVGIKDEK